MSIWRSVMAVRASLSRHYFSNHSLPSSQTLITRILHSTPLCSPQNPNPRFFSQTSDSNSDLPNSPEIASLNGGLQVDHFTPTEDVDDQNPELGDVGNAQMEGFVTAEEEKDDAVDEEQLENHFTPTEDVDDQNPELGDVGNAQMESLVTAEEEKDDAVDEEQLEKLLSLLRSSSGGGGGESFGSSLEGLDLKLNQEFVVRALETPHLSSQNLIAFVNWALREKKPEFRVTSRVVDSLVAAVCINDLSKSCAYSLWDLLKEIGDNEASVLSAETLNELIALLSKLGKPKAATEVFEKFGDFGITPDENTYYFTIEALCRRSMYDWASSLCEKMVSDEKFPESEKLGKIISWLCKGKKAKDAHLVYTLAKEKNRSPPRRSVDFLANSLSLKDETVRLAPEILRDFEGESRKYAIRPFSAAIRGLCRIKDAAEAKKLLLEMISLGPPPGNAAFNSIVHCFSKSGEMGEAAEIVKLMERRGLKPDVYTYTALISGYASGGCMKEARKILAEAERRHSKLTPATYHSVVRGYCKLGAFDLALEVLAGMESSGGVRPNADEYDKLIQSLCLKALDWETAEKLLEEVREKGLRLNEMTSCLVRAVKEMVGEQVETGKKLV